MAERVMAAELMFDERELARRARTTLAGAEQGVLVIADGSSTRYRECAVSVCDDGGEAVLGTPVLGSVAVAAGRNAHAALMLEPNQEYGVGLTLIGRISPAAEQPGSDPGQAAVALSVERVLAACPRPGGRGPRREIALDAYAAAEPDSIAAHGPRIARHLTEDHQDQLRALVAHCTGTPVDSIVAAQVSRIAAEAVQLWWLDADGAHPHRIGFEPPARDLADLGRRLRSLLEQHPH